MLYICRVNLHRSMLYRFAVMVRRATTAAWGPVTELLTTEKVTTQAAEPRMVENVAQPLSRHAVEWKREMNIKLPPAIIRSSFTVQKSDSVRDAFTSAIGRIDLAQTGRYRSQAQRQG